MTTDENEIHGRKWIPTWHVLHLFLYANNSIKIKRHSHHQCDNDDNNNNNKSNNE